jgi:hypothetical protein
LRQHRSSEALRSLALLACHLRGGICRNERLPFHSPSLLPAGEQLARWRWIALRWRASHALCAGFVDGASGARATTTNIERHGISKLGWVALARTEWIDAAVAGRPLIGDVISNALTDLSDA